MTYRYGKLRKGMKMRKVAAILGACLLLPSANLHALGMGEIDVHSGLNQPLDATIKLISVDEGELDGLEVSLAPRAAFDRMGLDRMPVLSKLVFEVVSDDGTPYVKVSSQGPVREPFLDFILSVDWANGQMLREYTLLLDPPIFNEGEKPSAVEAAVTSPATIERDAMEEFEQTAEREVKFAAGPGSYGPTKTSDTLWAVAKDMRPDSSVSVPQMMLALLKENPEAFFNNNVNQLKAGYILRAPQMDSIAALSKNEAAAEANRQYQSWLQNKGKAAVVPGGQRQLATDVAPTTDQMAGTTAPSAEAPAAVSTQARLQLVSPEDAEFIDEAGGTTEGKVAALRQQLSVALESVEVGRQENAELHSRLNELEAQLANMQRLITLQDDTMSALQGGLAAQEEELVTEAEVAAVEDVAATEESVTEGTAAGLAAVTTQEGVSEVAPAKPEPAAKPAPVRTPPPETSLLDDLLANPNTLAVAGGVSVLVLLLIGLMVRRRRQSNEEDFFETELPATGAGVAGGAAAAATSTATVADTAIAPQTEVPATDEYSSKEDSGLGEAVGDIDDYASFGEGLGTIHAEESEIDPIAEADVYLAYRRYEQAESLLKEAIQNDESRHELKLKLLEIYFTTKDQEAFEAQAEAFYAALGGAEEGLWDQAVEMGRELCPDHPLFSESGGAAVPASGAAAVAGAAALGAADEGILDLGDASSEAVAEQGQDLDFESLAAPEPAPAPEGESEFDLEGLSSESTEFDLDLSEPLVAEGESEAEIDLDLALGEEPAVEETTLADQELDIGFGEEIAEEASSSALDLDLNLDEPAAESVEAFETDMDLALGESGAVAEELEPDLSFDLDLAESSAVESESDFDLALGLDEQVGEESAEKLEEGLGLPGEAVDEFADLGLDLPDMGGESSAQDDVLEGLGETADLDAGEEAATVEDFSAIEELSGLDSELDLDMDLGSSEEIAALEDVNIEPSEEFTANLDAELAESSDTLDLDSFGDIGDLDNVVNFGSPDTSLNEPELSDEELAGLGGDLDGLASTLGEEAESMTLDIGESESLAEESAGDAESSSDWEVEPAMSNFGDMDEEYSLFESTDDVVGTKLDLAKAYIDMGDQDGARSILDEVVKEGSDTQREEAEQLMQQMG